VKYSFISLVVGGCWGLFLANGTRFDFALSGGMIVAGIALLLYFPRP
jgi:hypothetical protein